MKRQVIVRLVNPSLKACELLLVIPLVSKTNVAIHCSKSSRAAFCSLACLEKVLLGEEGRRTEEVCCFTTPRCNCKTPVINMMLKGPILLRIQHSNKRMMMMTRRRIWKILKRTPWGGTCHLDATCHLVLGLPVSMRHHNHDKE